MNPWTEDPPPTTSQAPGASHDGNTDAEYWWNKIEEDSASEPDEEEDITLPVPTAKAWNKPSEAVTTPFEWLPTMPLLPISHRRPWTIQTKSFVTIQTTCQLQSHLGKWY